MCIWKAVHARLVYGAVVEKAIKGWQGIDETLEKYRNQHSGTDVKFQVDPIRVQAASYEAKRELNDLLFTIDECVSRKGVEDANRLKTNPVKLVIYFDEAHAFRSCDAPTYPYDILCSCFTYFVDRPIFVIFLSTDPSLELFASSAHTQKITDALQAPITEVAFDCAPGLLVNPHTLRMQDLCSIEFMSKFGRPLFWTLIEGAGRRKNGMLAGLIDLVRSKLICKNKIEGQGFHPEQLTPSARLAVVDVRLMLDYEPRREAFVREAELIASHMRLAYSVPQHQAYFRSGYSSEPILGEAAAQQLHAFRQSEPFSLVRILLNNVQSGLIQCGKRGELVARALIVSAYDSAVEVDHPPPAGRPPLYNRGCRVITFIRELFSKEYANEILDSVPDKASNGVKLRDAFEHAQIRFTQYVKMGNHTSTTTAAMFAAFVRGFATICYGEQEMVDFMLPVLLWDELLCEEVMSAMMIQLKGRTREGPKLKYEIEESEIGSSLKHSPNPIQSRDHPCVPTYISLIMELGVRNKISEEAKTRVRVREKPKAAKSESTETPSTLPKTQTVSKLYIAKPGTESGHNQHTKSTHPRYNIFAYGCTSTVYKVIDASQKGVYALLLSSGNFLDQQPRESRASLKAVRMMKPFWTTGDCYHWIDNDFLSTTEYDKPDEGWLVTGRVLESDEAMDVSDEDTNVFDEQMGTNL